MCGQMMEDLLQSETQIGVCAGSFSGATLVISTLHLCALVGCHNGVKKNTRTL
jgi:hypothetical protein